MDLVYFRDMAFVIRSMQTLHVLLIAINFPYLPKWKPLQRFAL